MSEKGKDVLAVIFTTITLSPALALAAGLAVRLFKWGAWR